MNTLVQKFNKYAAIVLATLAALWMSVQANGSKIASLTEQFDRFVNQINHDVYSGAGRVSQLFNSANEIAGTYKAQAIIAAKNYTDQLRIDLNTAISGINLSVFGGRSKEQWEMYISNVIGTSITSEADRVNAMKEASEIVVVKLADFTGANIPFSSITKRFTLGNTTTHMFKFEAPLGAAQTKRNVTELPAQVNGATSIEVDNGDEIYITYDTAGVATIIVYDDQEAAVVASVLTTQATHGGFINTLIDDHAALETAFDAQAALVQTLFNQINSGGGYYYNAGASIGSSNLGA